MPSFSKNEVILVRYPFSDLTAAKIRPAVIVARRALLAVEACKFCS
jgi:hypothetical protein